MKLVRCKVCGLILPEGRFGDRCPACGVPASNLLPYVDPVGEARRRILKFHLHPIGVHFPTTLAVATLVFSIASFAFTGEAQTMIISAMKVVGVLLPLVVLGAGLLGILDGRKRYRKIRNSLMLKQKLIYAGAFLVLSLPIAVFVWPSQSAFTVLVAFLSALSVFCAIKLGMIGMDLDDSALPGR